ncbi:MAG: hypothetical protein JNK60_05120, partial [Acidobacteria bacterium]|nr:hypothetical protein [Acidobacteriota bacterium]
MNREPTPLTAATWPDPYPFYRRLRERAPFHRDEGLGLVIASGADAVTEVL